jgi:serine/threonine-protein kinase
VRLDAADYVHRPYGEVQAQLAGLGLRVVLATAETATVAPGLVTAVDPVGPLHPGDQVTVTYAVAPAASPTTQGGTPVELAMAAAPSRPAASSAASGDHAAGNGSAARKKSGGDGQDGGSGHDKGGHHGKPPGKDHGKSHGHGHHGKGHGGGKGH